MSRENKPRIMDQVREVNSIPGTGIPGTEVFRGQDTYFHLL